MEYKIKKGDTLWAIARDNGTTVDALAKANGISDPNLIYAGNVLTIPTSSQSTASTSGAKYTSASGTSSQPSGNKSASSATTKSSASGIYGGAALYESGKPTYTQSDAVKDAYFKLVEKENEGLPEFVSKYSDRIEALLSGLESREPFEYDFINDPMYRNYRDRYISDGRRAAKEAAALSSTLTGGYGNSYGTVASNEAFGRYMTKLSEIVPSLYEAALKRYDSEGESMLERLGLLRELDGDDYSRYRDTVSDRQNELDYLLDRYKELYDDDYGAYEGLLSQWNRDRDYGRSKDEYERDAAYKAERDRIEDAYKAERDRIEDSFKNSELAIKSASAESKKSSSTSTSKTSSLSKKSEKKTDIELGETARRLVMQVSMIEPDRRGVAEDAIVNSAKKAYKEGKITTKELNYIKGLF